VLVSSRDGIWQVLAQYALAMDEGRDDLLAACLTDDIVLHFPALDKTANGREEALEFLAGRRRLRDEVDEQARHVITNLYVIDESEREAYVVSYFTVVATSVDGTKTSSGWYRDRLVNDGGTWRFRERTVLSDRGGRSAFPALGDA
jgi:SnoaL-like protein